MKTILILSIAFVFSFVPSLTNFDLPMYESSYAEEANSEDASEGEETVSQGQEECVCDCEQAAPPASDQGPRSE